MREGRGPGRKRETGGAVGDGGEGRAGGGPGAGSQLSGAGPAAVPPVARGEEA